MGKAIIYVLTIFAGIVIASCSSNEQGDYLELHSDRFRIDNNTMTYEFHAEGSWALSSSDGWLHISPTSGTGDGVVTLTADENPSSLDERTTKLIGVCGGTYSATITQPPASEKLEVSPTDITFTSDGGEVNVSITSNGEWVITSEIPDWINIEETKSDQGNANLKIKVGKYTELEDRTPANIHIQGNKNGKYADVTVKQTAMIAELKFEHDSYNVDAIGKTYTINVISNTEWTITSPSEHVKCNPTEGNQSSPVTITVSDNYTTNAVTTQLTATAKKDPNKHTTCTINQVAGTLPNATKPICSNVGKHTATIEATFTSEFDIMECGFEYTYLNDLEDPEDVTIYKIIPDKGQEKRLKVTVTLEDLVSGAHYIIRSYAISKVGTKKSDDAPNLYNYSEFSTEGEIPNEGDNQSPNL